MQTEALSDLLNSTMAGLISAGSSPGSTVLYRFTSDVVPGSSYPPNDEFWLSGKDISACGVWNSNTGDGSIGCTAIAPNWISYATHTADYFPNGTTVGFAANDGSGNMVTMTIVDNSQAEISGAGDTSVAQLTENLPDTVTPLPLFTNNTANGWNPQSTGVPCIVLDQNYRAWPAICHTGGGVIDYWEAYPPAPNWTQTAGSGDSGHAVLVLDGSTVVYVGKLTSAAECDNLSDFVTDFNTVISPATVTTTSPTSYGPGIPGVPAVTATKRDFEPTEMTVAVLLWGFPDTLLLQRSPDGSSWSTIYTYTPSGIGSEMNLQYIDTGLTGSTKYYYRAIAVQNGGQGIVSPVSSATTF